MGSDDDTDFLFQSLRRVGYRQGGDADSSAAGKRAADKTAADKGGADKGGAGEAGDAAAPPPLTARMKSLSRKTLKGKGDVPRHSTQMAPPDETSKLRRSRLIRELEAGREEVFTPAAELAAGKRKGGADAPGEAEAARKPAAARPTAPGQRVAPENLRDLAEVRTPQEEYRRRRVRIARDAQIGPDGLDVNYARFDRRKQAMFFADMLATRQFDTFANDRIWHASRMESRIIFLNAVLAAHSKTYGMMPTRIDDRFYADVSAMPRSVSNSTGITGYDRERFMILVYPPFWNNAVSFTDMITEIVEQNTRNHVRQLAQLFSSGQLKADDPRFIQASIFNLQIETYDDLINAMTAERRKQQEQITTAEFLPEGEHGFDKYAHEYAQEIRERLLDIVDAGAPGRGR